MMNTPGAGPWQVMNGPRQDPLLTHRIAERE